MLFTRTKRINFFKITFCSCANNHKLFERESIDTGRSAFSITNLLAVLSRLRWHNKHIAIRRWQNNSLTACADYERYNERPSNHSALYSLALSNRINLWLRWLHKYHNKCSRIACNWSGICTIVSVLSTQRISHL